jgi:Tol biopolymer transport system component/CxxC motif-containing protein (DUF1111 family)
MKVLKLFAIAFFVSVLVTSVALTPTVRSQSGPAEAPAAFDNQTNGFELQGTDPTVPGTFVGDMAVFEKRDTKETGLGPVYNAQSCAECHQNKATGGVSQILEIRAGHSGPDGSFVPAPGGSLIQTRSLNTKLQERVPDGPRIVFQNNAGQVSFMGFDGGQNGNINTDVVGSMPSSGTFPAFSPDGARVVFSNSGNLWVVNNDGTNPNEITFDGTDFHPVWSLDGTKIAFTRIVAGHAQVFTISQFGTDDTNISNSAFNDSMPAYSPNGTKIAFVRSPTITTMGKIWTMNADGSMQMQVTVDMGNDERPTYSPDGTQIAFDTNADGNYEIYKVAATGGLATRLTNNAASDRNPSWSPDNTSIAFASDRSGSMNVWAIATDGTTPTLISPPSVGGNTPNYSKDTGENVRTLRASLNTLGDGFVESIADGTLLSIRDSQPSTMRGTAVVVDILEAPDQTRIGRFGWKDSIATLLTFSAAAYLNEVGITSPLLPHENSSLGRSVAAVDTVADPEDTNDATSTFGADVEAFTRFMRSTKAPDRDRVLVPDDSTDPGSALFDSLSCAVCHVRSITTAPVGSVINGGQFTVPDALGNKIIHPFSDFLLHDIGTGDGIVETNGELTRNKIRTAPLWGLRTHDKFMHDGGSSSAPSNSGAQSFALNEAILRHAGQATSSRNAFQALPPLQRVQLIRFLKSL